MNECEGTSIEPRSMQRSVKERLEDKVSALKNDLEDAENALKLLNENPEVSKVLEAISKVHLRI